MSSTSLISHARKFRAEHMGKVLIYVDEHGGLMMKNDEVIHDLLQKANVLCSSELFSYLFCPAKRTS